MLNNRTPVSVFTPDNTPTMMISRMKKIHRAEPNRKPPRNMTLLRQSLAESSGRPWPHRRPVGISGGPLMKRPQSTTTESSLP